MLELSTLNRILVVAAHPDDDHDPTPLELHCDKDPSAPECLIYDD